LEGFRGKEIAVFFWNCWVRNRFRLVAYLVLGCALILLGTLPVTMRWVHGHWVWVHPGTVKDAMDAWRFGVEHVALAMIFLMLFSAADLGSLGVGESAARREYDFLLTRPRTRRHFVWTAWLAGCTQLCLLALIPLAAAVMTLYALTSRLYPDRLWLLSLGMFELSVLVFSGAFALTLATGSSRNGLELVFSLLVVYYAVKQVIGGSWPYLSFWMPRNSYALGAYDWLLTDQQVHYGALLLMIPATVVLPFLAQFGFDRKDL
jgi:ABC-type transport system involved in multi-copper enzyme maturation permease subunit